MNRYEYMQRLTYLLRNLSAKDQNDALDYYNNYFDDAMIGIDDEVPSYMDSPEKVASSLGAPSSSLQSQKKKPMSPWMIA